MHVLVAAAEFQSRRDYAHTIEGELVYVSPVDCENPNCHTHFEFVGCVSQEATTTARIAELDVDRDDYELLIANGVGAGGWDLPAEVTDETLSAWLTPFASLHVHLADSFAAGTVIARHDEHISVRGRSAVS